MLLDSETPGFDALVVCRAFFLIHFRVTAFLHIQDMTTQLAQYCCRMRYFGIVVDTYN
jgi:hypothetical protein